MKLFVIFAALLVLGGAAALYLTSENDPPSAGIDTTTADSRPALGSQASPASDANGFPIPEVTPYVPYVVPNTNNFGYPDRTQPEREDFDYFSWQTFIGLMWPAAVDAEGRPVREDGFPNGKPDRSKKLADPGPRTWEAMKTDYELFASDGSRPSPWASYDVKFPPCPSCGGANVKQLPMVAKGHSVLPGGINQAMSGPLTPQQKVNGEYTWVRYEIRINGAQYNETRDKEWYLRKNLPQYPKPAINFTWSTQPSPPAPGTYGAMEIKAAWKLLTPEEVSSKRYYMAQAVLADPGTGKCICTPVTIGLVGFHFGHKTFPLSGWVWATFEHVDNVPCTSGEKAAGCIECGSTPALGYSFNNGTDNPDASSLGYSPSTAAKPYAPGRLPTPVQVIRYNELRKDIIAINRTVHALPGISGTVWQNYKLVGNQWPTENVDPVTKKPIPIVVNDDRTSTDLYPAGSGTPSPRDSVANITMETYFQNQGRVRYKLFGTSCMHCHYQAAQYDFSWALASLAFPSGGGSRGHR